MSGFWRLWHKAEDGDTEAAQQVNVLVARQLYVVRIRESRHAHYWDRHWLIDLDGNVLLEAGGVQLSNAGCFNIFDYAAKMGKLPDYMHDLNTAASLVPPVDHYMTIDTVAVGSPRDRCRVSVHKIFENQDYPLARLYSQSEAYARVGAWWEATTGEKETPDAE